MKNYGLLSFVSSISQNKELIAPNYLIKENYRYEFDMNVIISTVIETTTNTLILFYYQFNTTDLITDVIYFIPTSFLFELIFDLFHYVGHYTLHKKSLYKYFHKKHHTYTHPSPIITFYQDPVDIIVTNSIPFILTLYIVPKMSYFQYTSIIMYKTYGEICGHIGKKCHPTSSFCQFIWLPRILHIELYGEEHDLHHSLNNCNYSKRFSIWDKIFGTFKTPLQL
jgi:sterol desaturase/sphingolipid hydroxylase (fatty acid hydroxylase superfamily)